MRFALFVMGLTVAAGFAAMLWQHECYLNVRRHAVQDRQEMLYGGETFHVLTFLKVHPGADAVAVVRDFRKATLGGGGGRWIYAGKVAINVPSARIGPVEWSAVTSSSTHHAKPMSVTHGQMRILRRWPGSRGTTPRARGDLCSRTLCSRRCFCSGSSPQC